METDFKKCLEISGNLRVKIIDTNQQCCAKTEAGNNNDEEDDGVIIIMMLLSSEEEDNCGPCIMGLCDLQSAVLLIDFYTSDNANNN